MLNVINDFNVEQVKIQICILIDVDECVSGSQCGVRQQCINVEGFFSCSCQLGYRLDFNQDLECFGKNRVKY